jgi:hypothetical protein
MFTVASFPKFWQVNRLRADYGPFALAHYSELHELKDVLFKLPSHWKIDIIFRFNRQQVEWIGLDSWRLHMSSNYPAIVPTVRAS